MPPSLLPDTLPSVRTVIDNYNLRAEKKFGQNFLTDLNLTDKIVRAAALPDACHAIEIGPGPGALTRSLLASPKAETVTALELDARMVNALGLLKTVCPDRLNVMQGDALEIDLRACVVNGPRAIVANLPYNIATPLIIRWLADWHENSNSYAGLTLMVQREVAERIFSAPDKKTYGRLSVICQWLASGKICFDVPPSAFLPPPKVTSSVIHLAPRKNAVKLKDFQTLGRITQAAFGQRRKMVRTSMKEYTGYFETAGISPDKRAENISVEEYLALAQAVEAADRTQ